MTSVRDGGESPASAGRDARDGPATAREQGSGLRYAMQDGLQKVTRYSENVMHNVASKKNINFVVLAKRKRWCKPVGKRGATAADTLNNRCYQELVPHRR